MNDLEPRIILRRFLVLRASRWFPTGLIVPVIVLFLVDRGLSLAQIGMIIAAQGAVILALELPTGGLADAAGRKRVLLLANLLDLVSMVIVVLAPSLAWFVLAFALKGVFRALESGPLDAWFVDAIHEAAEVPEVEQGLSRGGVVVGLAMAAGAVVSGTLVLTDPVMGIGALTTPIVFAILFRLVDTVLLGFLMSEVQRPLGWEGVAASAREVPRIVTGAFRLVRTRAALGLVIGVELFWGFGMIAFETLFPVRLGIVLGSMEQAGGLMGPIAAAAWGASSVGAAVVPWFSRRVGRHKVAACMRVLQGGTVAAMAALGGVGGLVTAYLSCYLIHGAGSPVHFALIHDQAEASNRTTVVSLNSMVGMASAALGSIVLGAIADRGGVPLAMWTGAFVLAAAAPLYILAGRRMEDHDLQEVTGPETSG